MLQSYFDAQTVRTICGKMLRFTFILLLHSRLVFHIGFGLKPDDDTSKVCDCHCNCDVKIEVVNDDFDEDVGISENKIDTKTTNFEKQLLANRAAKPSSCMEAPDKSLKGGIYKIELKNINATDLEVFCEESVDFGGWLVIQRRQSGSVDFKRDWHDYKEGFGNITENFWIGLETLHALTSGCEQELYIQMKARNGTEYYAKYSHILIGNEREDYILKKLGNYSGSAGDCLSYHLGMKFSTQDRDNDYSKGNCAEYYHGGWWFKDCYRGYLNGRFGHNLGGLNWHDIEKDVSLVFAQMMIRPSSICWRKLMLGNGYQQV